jgi:hypothetical protein
MQKPDSVDQQPARPVGVDTTVPVPAKPLPKPVEIGGRQGPDPTRYGDWEKDGLACDF